MIELSREKLEKILVIVWIGLLAGVAVSFIVFMVNYSTDDGTIRAVWFSFVQFALYWFAYLIWVRDRRVARTQGTFPRVKKATLVKVVFTMISVLIFMISCGFIWPDSNMEQFMPWVSLVAAFFIVLVVVLYKKRANAPITQAGDKMPQTGSTPMTQEEEIQRKAQAAAQKVKDEERQNAKEAARIKAEAEKRRQAEEKAKRKAEEETRKKGEAEEKLRRKAEQDAHKKAEYEAELRRRTEAEAKAKAEADAKRRAEEDARMKRLQDIIAVSDRLSVQRIAQLLEMNPEDVWKHVVDWAKQFNFRIAGDDIIFNKETVDAFVASLDAEFRKWGKDGKA